MAPPTVSIIGLGLLGGSLGLALRASGLTVVGWDRDPDVVALAERLGAIDHAAPTLADAARASAHLVVVATPVLAVKGVFEAIAPHLAPGTVVTDVASTKRLVAGWAAAALPPDAPYVGGHPMAGREVAGVANAEAALFEGAIYCLVPPSGAPAWAVARVADVATRVGAQVRHRTAEAHDRDVAAVSHLPLLVAAGLTRLVAGEPGWEEAAELAASGFRDTTRLAAGDPVMHRDICLTNADELKPRLNALADVLRDVAERLDDPRALEAWLSDAKAIRDAWGVGATKRRALKP